jgi:hypothetical protein
MSKTTKTISRTKASGMIKSNSYNNFNRGYEERKDKRNPEGRYDKKFEERNEFKHMGKQSFDRNLPSRRDDNFNKSGYHNKNYGEFPNDFREDTRDKKIHYRNPREYENFEDNPNFRGDYNHEKNFFHSKKDNFDNQYRTRRNFKDDRDSYNGHPYMNNRNDYKDNRHYNPSRDFKYNNEFDSKNYYENRLNKPENNKELKENSNYRYYKDQREDKEQIDNRENTEKKNYRKNNYNNEENIRESQINNNPKEIENSPKSDQHKKIDETKIEYENNEKPDSNKNISFYNQEGELKIKQTLIIPNYLIYFFLKEKKKVSKIEKEYKCKIQILREDELNLNLEKDVKGRLVRFTATPENCISAISEFTNLLIKIETMLNGKREIETKID